MCHRVLISPIIKEIFPKSLNCYRKIVCEKGTYPPGTRISLEQCQVTIKEYLAEGGFSHVYLVFIQPTQDIAVLKRVAAPDSAGVNILKLEIEHHVSLVVLSRRVRYLNFFP
jgi:hypothetical protein